MRIIPKRNKNGGSLFVFEFSTREGDFVPFIDNLKLCAGILPDDDVKGSLLRLIETLEARCDDRYAKEDSEVSSMLFADEMSRFTMCETVILWCAERSITFKEEFDRLLAEPLELPEDFDEEFPDLT